MILTNKKDDRRSLTKKRTPFFILTARVLIFEECADCDEILKKSEKRYLSLG